MPGAGPSELATRVVSLSGRRSAMSLLSQSDGGTGVRKEIPRDQSTRAQEILPRAASRASSGRLPAVHWEPVRIKV